MVRKYGDMDGLARKYGDMDGLAGAFNLKSRNPNSQYSQLAAQNSAFGDYGTDLTNQALKSNTNLTQPQVGGDTGLFGLSNSTWGNIGTLGNLGLGAFNTWGAMKQLNLAKDAFRFNKDMKEKEYGMAKDAYDRNVARAAGIGEQMRRGAAS